MLVTSIFSFFPQCFLPFAKRISIFLPHIFRGLQMLWISTRLKHLSFGYGLRIVSVLSSENFLNLEWFSQWELVLLSNVNILGIGLRMIFRNLGVYGPRLIPDCNSSIASIWSSYLHFERVFFGQCCDGIQCTSVLVLHYFPFRPLFPSPPPSKSIMVGWNFNGLKTFFYLKLFHTRPFCFCTTSVLKTLWEKEKLLVTSNFSFSHSAFYPSGEVPDIFIKFKIVDCKLFQFGRV